MAKPPMTREQLLASDDPEDADFLEAMFQHDTYNDPEDDPFGDEYEEYEEDDDLTQYGEDR